MEQCKLKKQNEVLTRETLEIERHERFINTLEPYIAPDVGGFADVRPLLLGIVSAYSGESRFYHDMTHLEEMADFLLQRLDELENPKGVLIGMIVHDAVYNAGAYAVKGQNETDSWSASEEPLSLFYSANTLETAKTCTLATIDHLNYPIGIDHDVDIFLDADMAVLASSWERFQEYEEGIFREFTYTPSGELRISREAYVGGRLKFLKSLQGRQIFRTKGMEESEEKVQYNLVRMIAVLEDEMAA